MLIGCSSAEYIPILTEPDEKNLYKTLSAKQCNTIELPANKIYKISLNIKEIIPIADLAEQKISTFPCCEENYNG